MKLRFKNIALLTVVSFTTFTAAFAQEHSGEHHGSPADLLWFWVNFVLFIGILWFFTGKTLSNGLKSRKEKFAGAVRIGKNALLDAKKAKQDAESALSGIDREIKEIKEQIRRQADFEKDTILRSAKEKSDRMQTQATEAVEAEYRAARRIIEREMVERAVEKAREKIKAGMDEGKARRFRDSALGH